MNLAKKIIKNLLFLSLGLFIFWWIFKDLDFEILKTELHRVNWFWIAVSVILSLISHLSRAIRWNLLVRPLGYNMKLKNTFAAVLIMYFVNLLVPRAGEIARCTVLSKYEKVPFTNLVGTVIVERIADTIMLMSLSLVVFTYNYDIFGLFLDQHPEMKANFFMIFSLQNIIIGIIALLIITVALFKFKPLKNTKISNKFKSIINQFKSGILSILKLKQKWKFVFHTIFIFTLWLLMFSAVFLAYPPTAHLTIGTGIFVFLMSGFAMLLPVQGGIGPWHFIVMETLFVYGIDKADGKIFALIGHSSTSLIYLIVGFIAFMIIPYLNKVKKQ